MPTPRHFESHSTRSRNRHESTESASGRFLGCLHSRRPLGMRLLILGLGLGLGLALAASMSAQTAEESLVKAAYLYNFGKFVEWPSAAFRQPGDPVVICVLGDERTSDVLEHSVSGKRANGRPIQTRRPHSPSEFKSCHILFIGFSEKAHIEEVLHEVGRSSVLTVGQSADFLSLGGMINLALRDRTIELEIDPDVSNLAGLRISSRLLVVARIVKLKSAEGFVR